MAIRYAVLSAPSLRDRLQVLSKRLFEVDATPRNLPPLVADAAKYINDAGFLFDGSSDGRDRWPAGWEFLWPFNYSDRWLLKWLDLMKDVDYARKELESPTAEVDRDTVLAWLQAAFASHLQQWLSQCVPGMSLNPGSAFVPTEWRGTFAFRKYHWKHQGNLAASAELIGPSEYQQFADDVATVCAYLAQQLTAWLTVTESPAPIAPALPSLVALKGEGTPVGENAAHKELVSLPAVPKQNTSTNWPPDDGWHFDDGEAAFLRHRFPIRGPLLKLLKAFVKSAKNNHRSISKDDLLDAIENGGVNPGSDTLRGYVSRLRTLLRDEFKIDNKSHVHNPIPSVNRGDSLAYRFEVSTIALKGALSRNKAHRKSSAK